MTSRKTSTRARRTATASRKKPRERFCPGSEVEVSGIYEVFHALHRISHRVTLIEGHDFPPCSRCKDKVRFELVRANRALNDKNAPVVHVVGVFLPEAA